jgi:hypothetical protein
VVYGRGVITAAEKSNQLLFEEAIRQVSETMQVVAKSSQWAIQVLKDNGFM